MTWISSPVPGLLCLFVVIVVASRIMLYGIIPPFWGTLSYLLTLYALISDLFAWLNILTLLLTLLYYLIVKRR